MEKRRDYHVLEDTFYTCYTSPSYVYKLTLTLQSLTFIS